MNTPLSLEERQCLLHAARQSIYRATSGNPGTVIDPQAYPERLREPGASFVTLTENGNLRGCVGGLEAYQTLVEDVYEHAEAAALQDYRFPPVQACDVPSLHIEISCLTKPEPLEYQDSDDLVRKIRPGIDGVTLRDGQRRSTFLPQVWESLPKPEDFLSHLCLKMGAPHDLWQKKHLSVQVYQVECFEEDETNPHEVSENR